MSHRELGTASGHAAAGNHTHAYASTVHGDSHSSDGSDPLTDIAPTDVHPLRIVSSDGTGFMRLKAQASVPSSEMDTEAQLQHWVRSDALRPVRVSRSYWNTIEVPDTALWGAESQMAIVPGTSTTPEKYGAPVTVTGTLSHPTPTVANGFHMNLATAASTNSDTGLSSTDVRWAVGDAVNPWMGLWMVARIMFPDSGYNNSGASTGSRIFIGFTDQSVATMLGSDTPTGHRFGWQYCNVNGGKTQTAFQLNRRDGTTESLTSSAIGITQNKWYDFILHIHPNYSSFSSMYAQIRDVTANSVLYDSGAITGNGPGSTTFMRAMAGLRTINAVARNFKCRRLCVEAPID